MNRTFQRLEVFGSMTACDNIRTAAEIAARARRRSMRGARPPSPTAIIELLGLGRVADRRADALPTGQARLVELGRALATEPKVLLLDEPASGPRRRRDRSASPRCSPGSPTTAWPSCSWSTTWIS